MAALTLKQALAQFWLQITNKFVPRESGKGLSTNDYSNADKQKLNSIPATIGTITGVTAGNGLSGGGTSGAITLAAQVDRGLSIASDKIGHSNSVTAGTASEGGSARTLAFGGTFNVPSVTYDAQGHISGKSSIKLTMPAKPTYSAGTGISLSGTTFSNSGVRSISTGSANGTISVNTNGSTADVAVKGLGSAAYKDASGTWDISISGLAYKALLDGDGNTISSTYLPLAGGGLTGRTYSSSTVAVDAGASFRNINIVGPTTTIEAGVTAIPTGEIWIKYE